MKAKTTILALVAASAIAVPPAADAQWFRDGVRAPDQSWSKSEGNFGAMLLLSDEPDEFLDNWVQRTPGVRISTTRTARRGEPLAPFILFIGCQEDDLGGCRARFDLEVIKPDGTTLFRTPDLELWERKPTPADGTLGLAVGYAEIEVGDDDPLGRYLVRAVVREEVAGITLTLEQEIELFGTVTTVIGDGTPGLSETQVNNPYGVVIGPDGLLYFCDLDNQLIRRLDLATGVTETIAGNGARGYGGDGGPATDAMLNMPHEIQFDARGDLYIVERDNHAVRKVDMQTGVITTVAGTGEAGFSGDGGRADEALLRAPHSIVFTPDGQLLICDIGNHRIRRVDPATGVIETWAGTGEREPTPDGAPLAGTPLNGPRAMALDPDGNLYLALREGNAIYRIDLAAETIHHVAGTGEQGYTGDGGPGREATLAGPKGLAYAAGGTLYIADTENHVIRRLNVTTGVISTAIGTGERGDGPEPEPRRCRMNRPHGIWTDEAGALYVGDSEAHRIRILR
ncbi:MAG: hypothetical protein F4W89_17935 [Acidobacteria bacterium]|nr:hypothetical protein [Acidobacteriota bacterium]